MGKAGVTLLLLYLVSTKIDPDPLWNSLNTAQPLFLMIALALYTLSRILGAYRLQQMMERSGIFIPTGANLRFYWISMFYGMFLPGGLGGDAYKVFYLKKRYPEFTVLNLSKILLWDRILGFVVLVLLALIPALLLLPGGEWIALWFPVLAVSVLALRWCVEHWIAEIAPAFLRLLGVSVLIQLSQIATIIALMAAIGLHERFTEYALLFLVSSIASTLPLTVGGVGIREMAFLYGSQLLTIPREPAVASGFLFDTIVTVLALTGSIFLLGNRTIPNENL